MRISNLDGVRKLSKCFYIGVICKIIDTQSNPFYSKTIKKFIENFNISFFGNSKKKIQNNLEQPGPGNYQFVSMISCKHDAPSYYCFTAPTKRSILIDQLIYNYR